MRVLILLSCIFFNPMGAFAATTIEGLWMGSAEFRYSIPFAFEKVSKEYWKFESDRAIKTQVIGQQHQVFEYDLRSRGENTFELIDDRGDVQTIKIEQEVDKLKLCQFQHCRFFSKIQNLPTLNTGTHRTPRRYPRWVWKIDGEEKEYQMAINLFHSSYAHLGLHGVDFRHPFKEDYALHMIFFTYLMLPEYEEVSSYSASFVLAVSGPGIDGGKVIKVSETPVPLKVETNLGLKVMYEKSEIEFSIRFE